MISAKAIEDYEDLRADGLNPSLEDFVRLNSLALRMERGGETTAANAPRIGWAGNIPFHQPTVAAFEWYLRYGERAAEADDSVAFLAWPFALHNARRPDVLARLETPADIRAAIGEWKRTIGATTDEISRACAFTTHGLDDAQPGRNPNAVSRYETEEDFRDNALASLAVRVTECAASLGTDPLRLVIETPSRLDALFACAAVARGAELKPRDAQLYTDYKFALVEIRERLKKDKDDGDQQEVH